LEFEKRQMLGLFLCHRQPQRQLAIRLDVPLCGGLDLSDVRYGEYNGRAVQAGTPQVLTHTRNSARRDDICRCSVKVPDCRTARRA
jgi:hypothetical protein